MSVQITLGSVSDFITPSDRRAILAVLEGRKGFSTWFDLGGNKKYYLEIDIDNLGSRWFYFKTRRIVNNNMTEMKQHIKIETS